MSSGPETDTVALDSLNLAEAGSRSSEVIAGRFEILGLLGSGGMGSVYRARDRQLDEIVALKMIREGLSDARLAERLLKEVKLSRRVTHRNVARVFELGEHNGDRFFTMELVEGESLRDYLAKRGAIAIPRALEIATAICRGLSAAHEVGVIHRDLKPDNVLLGRDGRIALTDFGIAASLVAGGTDTRSFVGTPLYMSPEQVDGQHAIDGRSDLYALGVVLFEMLTGEAPWEGATPLAVAAARLMKPPPDPAALRAALPRALADLVLRAMARDPADRFQSALELEQALVTLDAVMPTLDVAQRPSLPAPSIRYTNEATRGPASRWATDSNLMRIALLPFKFAGPAEKQYLADGLLDDLIDAVSTTKNLRVLSRRQVEACLGQTGADGDVRSIGRALDVDVIAEGAVRALQNGQYRLSLRLISATDGLQLWAKRSDVTEAELLELNEMAAASIAAALTKEAPLVERKLSDPRAIDLYLRARSELKAFSPDAAMRSAALLGEALQLVPDDPTLLAMYAIVLSRLNFFFGDRQDAALQAAERAVSAAPSSADAHVAKSAAHWQAGQSATAGREAAIAVKIAPSLGSARQALGRILAEIGPLDLARKNLELAYEVEPDDSAAARELARTLFLLGRDAECKQLLEHIEDGAAAPEQVANVLVRARFAMWRNDRDELRKQGARLSELVQTLSAVAPDRMRMLEAFAQLTGDKPLPSPSEVGAMIAGGAGDALRRNLFSLQLTAELAIARGEIARAVEYASQASARGLLDLVWLDHCPLLDPLRELPVFASIRGPVAARAAEVMQAIREGSD